MALQLYNTLTRRKDAFVPLDPAKLRLYVCGPTVYDFAHIGNARPLIVFDVLFRLLRHLYGPEHVVYVRNITDVDDKINARAAERGITIRELTEETNAIFQEDALALGCLPPTVQPRATEHIAPMIAIIEKLIANGNAYAADGHVLFSVPSMPNYGQLSRRPLDEMIAGARVDVAPYKRGDLDFVLWKPSSESEPGWESPWGRGRPGWHIECSAMSFTYLGETFDIHGGGIDLVFPHHENEIAQSCCAFGRDVMANVWMHNGFLQVEGEKMSKSLGNFITIRELLATNKFGNRAWPGDVLRLAMLKTHYRQPIDWRVESLRESENELLAWATLISEKVPDNENNISAALDDKETESALCEDLNTPLAVSQLHKMFQRAKSDQATLLSFVRTLKWFGFKNITKPGIFSDGMMSFVAKDTPPPTERVREEALRYKTLTANGQLEAAKSVEMDVAESGFSVTVDLKGILMVSTAGYAVMTTDFNEQVEHKIKERLDARKAKDWAASDRIRDELAAMGVALKDNKDGTTSWEVKR